MAFVPPGQVGQVSNPVFSVRLNNASTPVDMTLSAAIDATFGSSQGQTLFRGASNWYSGVALGPYSLTFTVKGAVSVANDVDSWKVTGSAFTWTNLVTGLKTAAVGANLIFDVLSSPDGTTFTSTTGGSGFSITAGNKGGAAPLGVLPGSYPANTIFRLDILQVGSGTAGSDLTVIFFGDAAQ